MHVLLGCVLLGLTPALQDVVPTSVCCLCALELIMLQDVTVLDHTVSQLWEGLLTLYLSTGRVTSVLCLVLRVFLFKQEICVLPTCVLRPIVCAASWSPPAD